MSMMRCERCGDAYIDTDNDVESWVTLAGLDKWGQPNVACWCYNCRERYADEIPEEA